VIKVTKLILILFVLGLIIPACSELFEPGNNNLNFEDRLYYDPSFAEGILINAYTGLNKTYTFSEVATDDAVSNVSTDNFRRVAAGEWSSIFNPMDVWADSYSKLYYINCFLKVVDNVSWYPVPNGFDPTKDSAKIASYKLINTYFKQQKKGEAFALRAIYHFRLLQAHAGKVEETLMGIPLMTETIQVEDNWKLARNSFDDCITQIDQDLDSAIFLLPEKFVDDPLKPEYTYVFGTQNQNRINATIAKAVKARVAVLVASPAFEPTLENWQNAASLNGNLIKSMSDLPSTSYSIDNDYYDNLTNAEIIWRYDKKSESTLESLLFPLSLFGKGTINPSQNLVDAFPALNGYPISDVNSSYLTSDPYKNRDPRLKKFIVYNGNLIGNKAINTTLSDTKDGLNTNQNATRTGYYVNKLVRSDVVLKPTLLQKQHFVTLMRYTEFFLNYAEAANEAWGPDADPQSYGWTARSVLAAIRKRAGITQPDAYLSKQLSKEQLRVLIRNERRIELCFEGFRFWDVRRWMLNLNETVKGIQIEKLASSFSYKVIDVETRNYKTPQMYYGPIPYKETLKYQGLSQNNGW